MRKPGLLLQLFLLFLFIPGQHLLWGQRPANSNPYYQQLRSLTPAGETLTVNNLELRRDAAVFHFDRGSFAFFAAVNGKITGAVFQGQGHLHITPPTAEERHNLSILTHSEQFDEDFNEAVLRFSDGTAAELQKTASGKGAAAGTDEEKAAKDLREFARTKLHDNFDLRLLADVLSPAPGGYFMAGMHGRKNPHLIFFCDPQGVSSLAPEEIALLNWNSSDEAATYPLAFHRAAEYAQGTASGDEHNAAYRIENEDLDVTIERSGFLSALATVQVQAQQDGVAVVPLDLYATLRVSQVQNSKGEALDFVQEKKDEDPDFGVILAQPLRKGETATLKITYGGKDVVFNKGAGNYYPVARENWYPNASQGLGDYANYRMTFHVPKGLQLIATGTKVSEKLDGKGATSEWKTDTPLAVVGFSLGDFIAKDAKFGTPPKSELSIAAFANRDLPDFVAPLANQSLGTLNTTPMLGVELSQGEAAAQIYTDYFGALPFNHISLTQQAACDYGQSWPMLVYLPICGFFDSTQQHFLGLGADDMYWKMVTPHEVAHQWWGQTVGFRSYRDQWMSEGFADASASIFLQLTRPNPDDFRDFWKQARRDLTEKNQFGFRAIDVGPVTMGIRLSSPKAGWNIYRDLVYPKGAYILHMVRMMMWSPNDGDARFIATMHDFAGAYCMRAATTEDFKAMVEKHMSPQMNLDGNQRMDWFFNQYVYGTELPNYHFEGQVTMNGDVPTLHFKLTQSGVSASFRIAVPIYLELTNKQVLRLGSMPILGNNTVEKTVQLQKLPGAVKRVMIDYNYDVLSTEN